MLQNKVLLGIELNLVEYYMQAAFNC
jgi:hypothetical protein